MFVCALLIYGYGSFALKHIHTHTHIPFENDSPDSVHNLFGVHFHIWHFCLYDKTFATDRKRFIWIIWLFIQQISNPLRLLQTFKRNSISLANVIPRSILESQMTFFIYLFCGLVCFSFWIVIICKIVSIKYFILMNWYFCGFPSGLMVAHAKSKYCWKINVGFCLAAWKKDCIEIMETFEKLVLQNVDATWSKNPFWSTNSSEKEWKRSQKAKKKHSHILFWQKKQAPNC